MNSKDGDRLDRLERTARHLNFWLGALAVLTALVLAKGISLEFMSARYVDRMVDQAESELTMVRAVIEEVVDPLFTTALRAEKASSIEKDKAGEKEGGSAFAWDDVSMMDTLLSLTGFESKRRLSHEDVLAHDYFSLPLSLRSNNEYTFFAVCDEHCSDLDLTLFRDGNVRAADSLPDSLPIISFSPESSGDFILRVTMFDCKPPEDEPPTVPEAREQGHVGCDWILKGYERSTARE